MVISKCSLLLAPFQPQVASNRKMSHACMNTANCVMSFPASQRDSKAKYKLPSKAHHATGVQRNTGDIGIKHARKLKEVTQMLRQVGGEDRFESLVIVEVLQRLGIEYHFQEDIGAILRSQYNRALGSLSHHYNGVYDLREVALRFRLLRQAGYHVPSDMFRNFKNEDKKFGSQKLTEDVKGLMELYEASHLSIEGEQILDEAGQFSSHLLNAWTPHLDQHQARMVATTLNHPYHKTIARFMIKNFISNFQCTNEFEQTLVDLAKLEFNLAQSLHQEEVVMVSRWWKDLGLAKELKFVRDEPAAWYMWPLAGLTDSSLSEERVELAKPISLIYTIDDIFDIRGTIDELSLFTEAVNRWEISAIEQLPDYMKICFRVLYDITNEISFKVYKKHGWNPIDSLQKAWAKLCNAFLVEAKWLTSGQFPKANEYLTNGIVSSGIHVLLVHVFFLLGEGITKETVDLVNDISGITSCVAKILRLWDDLDDKQDGRDGSYLSCYMKEHPGTSVEEAREHAMNMISDSWKQLNQECLCPNLFSPTFTKFALNIARMVPVMYAYDDAHSLPSLKEHVNSLLFERVSH